MQVSSLHQVHDLPAAQDELTTWPGTRSKDGSTTTGAVRAHKRMSAAQVACGQPASSQLPGTTQLWQPITWGSGFWDPKPCSYLITLPSVSRDR